jgi:hypothetical protein
MLLWKIHVGGNNKTQVDLHVKAPMFELKKKMLVCLWSSLHVKFN